MSSHFRRIVVLASAALFAAPLSARAQTLTRASLGDSRWDPWLGCWGVDTSGEGGRQSSPGITCVIPAGGARGVEAVTYARGKVVARDHLDNGGEPHAVSGQGCRGFETIDWVSSGRRAMLRSDYVCGGTRGSSSTIYAIAPGGDWLRVEQVRSGTGAVVSVERRRPVPLIPEISADAARMIEDRRMAITTARAAAATMITTDEVIEAVHVVDPGVVRSWIVASGQSFDLDGAQLATLIRADVPQSVLTAMMPYENAMPAPALVRPVTVYGAAPVAEGPVAYASANANDYDGNGYGGCPSMSCNQVPNPYSILNGYGVYPYGYGFGGSPFFSPFNSSFPSIVINNRGNNNNKGHNNNGHRPVGRPFVRPVGTTTGTGTAVHGVPFAGGRRR